MYLDAFHDRRKDRIRLVLIENNERVYRDAPAKYVFYYEHPEGAFQSIFGHRCRRVRVPTHQEFRSELAKKRAEGVRIFESDINPVFRYLSENYSGAAAPPLNIGFFDIEADFDAERGYAPPDNPFNAVTAISLYRSGDGKLLTFVLCPPTLNEDRAQEIAQGFADCRLFVEERKMLEAFLDAIEHVSLLTGWNSSDYDVPYLVNRVKRVIGVDATRRFCLWNELPQAHEYQKFGRTIKTYKFVGRVHLDYIELYRKHNTQQRLSYALAAIGEIEVGKTKIKYERTLDHLYKHDFDRFIEYNRQDVMLMVDIDAKLQYIQLANEIAHANTVLLPTTTGSVGLIEQAIINEMHSMQRVVPDRKAKPGESDDPDDDALDAGLETEINPVVGAYVAQPVVGLHEWLACADINSLYPSAIRALNMSPETLCGQVRPIETTALISERVANLPDAKRAEAWDGVFESLEVSHMRAKDDTRLTVDFFDPITEATTTEEMTGAALHDYVFDPNNHVCITANGTLFRTDVDGMIPTLLANWYAERKAQQKLAREFAERAQAATTPEERVHCLEQSKHYDFLQYAAKIRLNSLYGALLYPRCRFGDPRLGQSTTLSGRVIVKHMNATINQVINGVYDHCGTACVYADTDSVAAESLVTTNRGEMTIERLFDLCGRKWTDGLKEYACDAEIQVMGFDPSHANGRLAPISYVYRHRIRQKKRFRITSDSGQSVDVTEDHCVMVERGGKLVDLKPSDVREGDTIVTFGGGQKGRKMDKGVIERAKVAKIEQLDDFENEYVYDIGMADGTPWFFANGILVHNSCYFSAYESLKDDPDHADFAWTAENVIQMADLICAETNETFPEFMQQTFHTTAERGGIIRAGRELVAKRGLFVKKKKYAVLVIDKEGTRLDVDGAPGKLKPTGLEMKRADTPEFMQRFLERLLIQILTGQDQAAMYRDIQAFRSEFKQRPGWEKGSPRRVSKLIAMDAVLNDKVKVGMGEAKREKDPPVPQQVRASLNWNQLCDMHDDRHVMRITDGARVIVCKLKPNSGQMTSVAYPIDEPHLPEWFRNLPFDHEAMEDAIIDAKVNNLVGVLNWDLSATKTRMGDDLITF